MVALAAEIPRKRWL